MAITEKQTSKQTTPKPKTMPEWSLLLIFCAIVVRVQSLVFNRGFTSYDDGVISEGARLVFHGKIPYRDFWTMYTPGSFYVNAFSFVCFGEQLISIRLLGLVLGAFQAALFYSVVRRATKSTLGGLSSATVYLSLIPIGIQAYWVTAVLAGVYSLIRFIEKPDSRWCYLCGLCAGMTLLFRQDTGVYLLAAMIPVMYLTSAKCSIKRALPAAKAIAITALVVGSTVAYFACHGALAQMIDSTVRFAIFEFPASRPLPYPVPWKPVAVVDHYYAPLWISFAYQAFGFHLMPAALIVLSGVFLRWTIKKQDKRLFCATSLTWVALLLVLMARIRPAGPRIMASALIFSLALSAVMSTKNRLARTTSAIMLVLMILAFAPYGAYTIWAQHKNSTTAITGGGGVYAPEGLGGCLAAVTKKIDQLTAPSEKILSGTPAVYFLSQRDPVTYYYEPHPCVTDNPQVEQTIIRDIEKNHMRYFVRSREWGPRNYFTIERQHEPELLDSYIRKHYVMKYDYAVLQIYERNTPFE